MQKIPGRVFFVCGCFYKCYNMFMKIISNKQRNQWAIMCVVTGILVIYLSAFYIYMFQQGNKADSIINYIKEDPIGVYFMINSFLLTIYGFLLWNKKIYYYNIISIILFISVVIGWLVPTIASIVLSGFFIPISGGPITIPLFHVAVIGSFISSINRLRGKTKYEDEVIINNQ